MRKRRAGAPATGTLGKGHEGKACGVEIECGQFLEHGAGTRTREHGDGPLLCHLGQIDLEIGPFGLVPLLEPGHHVLGPSGGGGDVEAIPVEPGGDAVVHHQALVVQHEPVAAASDAQGRPEVRVHALEQDGGVGTLDVDLAEGRGVEESAGLAHGPAFPLHGCFQVLAGLWIGPGP